jgi:phage protein D/phage baseplate assembly protein gpV
MTRSTAIPYIKIGGQDVSKEFMDDLLEIVVDTSLYLPSMFTLEVLDERLKWVDDALLDIGKPVEISLKTDEEAGGVQGTLIKGEITALEPHFSAKGRTTMLVRGYDKSHRLHRGKKTRTFLKMKDSDIASKIASEAGLTAQVDATTVTYDFVLQNNQTNIEFLLARAERIGYQVFAAEGKLYFKKGSFSLGEGPKLAYAEGLGSFRPCWTASGQADKVIVNGWDPKGKKAISSQKTPNAGLNQGGMKKTGGATAKSAFRTASAIITDRPVCTAQEATALATGLSNDISREFVQAEGMCKGHPQVKAGWKVTIQKVGTRFSGTYFVTSATHIYNEDGYHTTFSITGRQPNTLSHLLDSGNGHGPGHGLVQGVVTGLVTNLNDPDNLGRVKVKYGWLGKSPDGAEIESDWVRIAAPMGGAERGFFYLPEVNDEVLVAFEHGDVHHPYIVGVLWSSTDKPPLPNNQATKDGKVNQRIIKSRSGHVIILDDTDGQEQIVIRDKTEKNEIVIDSKENTLTVKVDKDITVEAKGKINVKSTSDDLTFEGKNMTIKTQQNFKVQATGSCSIKSTQNCTVEGTAGLTIKNAAAKVALSGPTVNINNGALEVM